uniref:Uncharacterized protein n=1 Tax=Lepeophtheirus salmonis TaxID=72036 RepID=A0A0K2TF45_LEPSM
MINNKNSNKPSGLQNRRREDNFYTGTISIMYKY